MIVSQNFGNVDQKPNSLYIRWRVDPNLGMVASVIVRNNKLNNILFLFVFCEVVVSDLVERSLLYSMIYCIE